MIFLVCPNCTLLYEDLVNLHDRLETELNSNVGNRVVVIPDYCEYSIVADVGEHPINVREVLDE